MLETEIEKKVCDYAKERGLLVYKFTSPNRRSVPDRMFIRSDGFVFFCEFKATGKKPTPQQEREHERLGCHNINVNVVDSVEYGKQVIDHWVGFRSAYLP